MLQIVIQSMNIRGFACQPRFPNATQILAVNPSYTLLGHFFETCCFLPRNCIFSSKLIFIVCTQIRLVT